MRRKNKLVHDIGMNDFDGSISKDGIIILSYSTWCSILSRVYSEKQLSTHSSYSDCTVCEDWKLFSNFKQWFDENHIEGYEIDKDILVEGNKIYSPDTCRYVPKHINRLIRAPKRVSEYGNGVYYINRLCKFKSQISINNKSIHLGIFNTINEARKIYTETKQKIVKERAIESFLANEIKSDVYLALVRRKF